MYRFLVILALTLFFIPDSFATNGPVNFRRVCLQENDSDITLSWIPDADGCNSFLVHYIYSRSDSTLPFTFLDSVTNNGTLTYQHKGANKISKFWEYYIVTRKLCNGTDSVSSDTLRIDFQKPNITQIDSVSIDINTGIPIIGWPVNTTPDLEGTVVFRSIGSNNLNIGSTGNLFFRDSARAGLPGPHRYTASAFDSCQNRSPFSVFHKTILLQGSFDPCTKTVQLNWNAYEGWPVGFYELWYKAGFAGAWTRVSAGGATSATHNVAPAFKGDTIYYFTRAFKGGGGASSTSTLLKYYVPAYAEPQQFHVRYATVTSDSAVELAWTIGSAGDYAAFSIYKGNDTFNLNPVAEVPIQAGVTEYTWVDNDVKTGEQSYGYKITCLNPCKQPGVQSKAIRTIFLQTAKVKDGNNCLFNYYFNFEQGVEQHSVYRGTDINGFTWNSIATVSATAILYEDIALPEKIGNTGLCYYIEALEYAPGTQNVIGVSRSNISCVVEDIKAFFPNAFVPDGVNSTFGPKGLYIDHARSRMEIYNRWGERVFETNNTSILWDGTMNGKPCPDGVYVYRCILYSLNGKEIKQDGTLHLIR